MTEPFATIPCPHCRDHVGEVCMACGGSGQFRIYEQLEHRLTPATQPVKVDP